MADPKNPVETIEFIEAMIRSWKLEQDVMADKKINMLDLPAAFAAAPALYKGFVGLDRIDDELKVVDVDGKAMITAKVEEFVIASNEELEKVVEEIVKLVLHIVEVSTKTVSYFKPKE